MHSWSLSVKLRRTARRITAIALFNRMRQHPVQRELPWQGSTACVLLRTCHFPGVGEGHLVATTIAGSLCFQHLPFHLRSPFQTTNSCRSKRSNSSRNWRSTPDNDRARYADLHCSHHRFIHENGNYLDDIIFRIWTLLAAPRLSALQRADIPVLKDAIFQYVSERAMSSPF